MNLLALQLLCLFVLVVLSALFSATEMAYTGLDGRQLKRLNRLYPGALSLWEQSPDRVLATLLLSNNAVNTAVGVASASMATTFAEVLGVSKSMLTLALSFIAGTILLFFGEIIPKIWAQQFTVSWALAVTPFMRTWSRWLSPFSRAAASMAHAMLLGQARPRSRSSDGRPAGVRSAFLRKPELRRILLHSRLPSDSRKLLDNVIDFGRSTVADVMTDRSSIVAVPLNLPMEKVIQNVIKSGWSRVPVYSIALDNILGLLYSKDLLVAGRSGTLVVLQDLLRPILTVTPEMPLPDLLRLFRVRHQHMAVVRKWVTGGRVLGLVTLQDALEAIVGEIKEENV